MVPVAGPLTRACYRHSSPYSVPVSVTTGMAERNALAPATSLSTDPEDVEGRSWCLRLLRSIGTRTASRLFQKQCVCENHLIEAAAPTVVLPHPEHPFLCHSSLNHYSPQRP